MEFRPENLRSLRPLAGDGSKLYIETYIFFTPSSKSIEIIWSAR